MKQIQRVVFSVFIRSESGVLLLRRRQVYSEFRDSTNAFDSNVGYHFWELPGGGIEPGESPAGAAIRETKEETGIAIEPKGVRPAACCAYVLFGNASDGGIESHRIHVIYEAEVIENVSIEHSQEHDADKWVQDPSELQELLMVAEIRNSVAALL